MIADNKLIKAVTVILVLVLMFLCSVVGAAAASDFVVENGVLISYTGTSQKVTIPSDVYCISDDVFNGNKKLKTVDLNNVTVIGNGAFRNCTSLTKVENFDAVTSCGAFAFQSTPFLEQNAEQDLVMGSVLVNSKATGVYTIPSHIKAISPYAFAQNTKLTSITIGDNVSTIGEGAFWNCTALKTVNLSSSVSHIGAYAFESTKFLSSVQDEFLIMGNGILVDVNSTNTKVTIPSDVKQIGGAAFEGNTKLKSVTIPEGVSAIGKRAFAKCSSLSNIDFPESVVCIETEAFYNCSSLKNVTIPETVSILGDSVFLGCTSMKTATVYANAPISAGLFAGCTKLESVAVSMNPELLRAYAFYGCENLSELSLPGSITHIADNAFEGCSKLTVWCYADEFVGETLKQSGINVREIGDSNNDGKLNIKDSTHIRKYIAGLVSLDFSSSLKADTDFNGQINVRDATRIQKKLVGVV